MYAHYVKYCYYAVCGSLNFRRIPYFPLLNCFPSSLHFNRLSSLTLVYSSVRTTLVSHIHIFVQTYNVECDLLEWWHLLRSSKCEYKTYNFRDTA